MVIFTLFYYAHFRKNLLYLSIIPTYVTFIKYTFKLYLQKQINIRYIRDRLYFKTNIELIHEYRSQISLMFQALSINKPNIR